MKARLKARCVWLPRGLDALARLRISMLRSWTRAAQCAAPCFAHMHNKASTEECLMAHCLWRPQNAVLWRLVQMRLCLWFCELLCVSHKCSMLHVG